MKHTAEEVRQDIRILCDGLAKVEEKVPAMNRLFDVADTYADLLEQIKADEGVANKLVVPVAWMCETVNGYKVFNAEGPSFPCNAGVVSELFTHPPAQAAQGEANPGRCKACGRATRAVCDGLDGNGLGCTNAPSIDIAAVRKVIAHLRQFDSPYTRGLADKLEAAIKGEPS